MKQSFHFTGKSGKVFGCSFRKARNGQYFGWVTIYNSEKDYKEYSLNMTWQDIKNIPLQNDNPIEAGIELKEYCINELEKRNNIMNNIIIGIKKEIKKELLPKLELFKDFKIVKIYRQNDYLGYYKNGSYKKPIIKLNIPQIYNACQKYNVDLKTGIYSTILHEIGHCLQEIKNKEFDEEEAENFAYDYLNLGRINKI